MKRPSSVPSVRTGDLKAELSRLFEPTHPMIVAMVQLPETVTRDEYLAQLRLLLPLARIKGG